ncbi:MAG: UTP--glucose-1-phosphate uridylyltransferase GalU [Dehalococcoidia bacterium]|nr:UTP--glucose-1-phosphate uridylyltransferase GalU [Dehalococcoidia bacterium]
MTAVRKAVVTAAGWGTRFLPATKAQPKETLPIVDKPMIQYVVEEAVAAGITQIIVVTAAGKRAIEDHFDRSFELESALAQQKSTRLLEEVRRISDLADFYYIRQKEQLGLGHAVLTARGLVGHEPFAVLLPDDIIDSQEPALKQMLRVFERVGGSVVGVERVPTDQIPSYGIVEPKPLEPRLSQILRLIEKPSIEEAPSNIGIVGRYILTPEIFECLEQVPPGKKGEIQLTDALQMLLKRQSVYAYEFEGTRYDAGTPLGLIKASVEFALKRADIGPALRQYLRDLPLDAPTATKGKAKAAPRRRR